MADKPKKKRKLKEAEAVEVYDDAWERFTSTVKEIVPPKDGRRQQDRKGDERQE